MSVVVPQAANEAGSPRHVAIIMDGNGRWAQARGLPRTVGHKHGVEAVRTIVEAAQELGIRKLTLYGFSTENWKRPSAEVSMLMGLLKLYLHREVAKLDRQGVRITFIGQRDDLPEAVRELMRKAEERTHSNRRLDLCIALSYGGRAEIIHAVRAIAAEAAEGRLNPDQLTEADFEAYLQTEPGDDPDLLIRTSGEQRLSNFLMWQSAYTELVFDDVLWPDFGAEHLENAIHEYQRRERRYGAVSG